jgi:hypothetical protein
MQSLGPLRRAVLLALSIVQMGAPALASVADAALASRASDTASRTHVEDHTHRSCAAAHPDDCALCQFLSNGAAPRASVPALPVVQRAPSHTAQREFAGIPSARTRAAEQPRAPPALA